MYLQHRNAPDVGVLRNSGAPSGHLPATQAVSDVFFLLVAAFGNFELWRPHDGQQLVVLAFYVSPWPPALLLLSHFLLLLRNAPSLRFNALIVLSLQLCSCLASLPETFGFGVSASDVKLQKQPISLNTTCNTL